MLIIFPCKVLNYNVGPFAFFSELVVGTRQGKAPPALKLRQGKALAHFLLPLRQAHFGELTASRATLFERPTPPYELSFVGGTGSHGVRSGKIKSRRAGPRYLSF